MEEELYTIYSESEKYTEGNMSAEDDELIARNWCRF